MVLYVEKRKYARSALKSPAFVGDVNSGDSDTARLVNYSRDGMYIETDRVMHPSQEIFIGFENLPSGFSSDASRGYCAKVIWQKALKESIFNYGYGVTIVSAYKIPKSKAGDVQTKQERRKHPRKPYNKPAFFTSQTRYYRGLISNISRGGMFIDIKDNFTVGQIIRLVIPETKIDNGVMLKGVVVHRRQQGIGIKFKKIIKGKSI